MKERNYFVSNSSSSSFLIACRKDLTKKEIEEEIKWALYAKADEIARVLVRKISEDNYIPLRLEPVMRDAKNYFGTSVKPVIHTGEVSDESDNEEERNLRSHGLAVKTPNMYVRVQGVL